MSAEASGWVWRHSPYSGNTMLVYLAIADVVNDRNDHELWMKVESLAAKARCGMTATRDALARLVEDGHLIVVDPGGGRGRARCYRFTFGGCGEPPNNAPQSGGNVPGKPTGSPKETHRIPAAVSTTKTTTQELKAARNPKAVENLRSSLREGTVR